MFHRTQESILLTRLPINYYERIELRNSKMEEVGKARYMEGCGAFMTSLGEPLPVHQPGSCLEPVLLGFLEASLHRHD